MMQNKFTPATDLDYPVVLKWSKVQDGWIPGLFMKPCGRKQKILERGYVYPFASLDGLADRIYLEEIYPSPVSFDGDYYNCTFDSAQEALVWWGDGMSILTELANIPEESHVN